jgi:hypothetical protein
VDVGFLPAVIVTFLAIRIRIDPKLDGAAHGDDIVIEQEPKLIFASLTGDCREQQEKKEAECAGHHER